MPVTKFISGRFVIAACDGTALLAKADQTFQALIDPNFRKWNLDHADRATDDTPVLLYDLPLDHDRIGQFLYQISPGRHLPEYFCLTQHQIRTFCETYPGVNQQTSLETFFLLKPIKWKQNFVLVVRVGVDRGRLFATIHNLGDDSVWRVASGARFVLPQTVG